MRSAQSKRVRAAMWAMQLRASAPDEPSLDTVGLLSEVFDHPAFVEGTRAEREQIMLASARAKYKGEKEYPFDNYFGRSLQPFLVGRAVLDLGCFTGGVSVAWKERYQIDRLVGVDIRDEFIEAARLFSTDKGVSAEFRVGFGEALPLKNSEVDAIVSFDVLEHVRDPKRVLSECRRVLKTGGHLAIVFPSYWHPIEHHLGLATTTPALQYFFSGRTLVRAYQRLLEERGTTADWYRRASGELDVWERGNTINGTTVAQFRSMLDGWHVVLWNRAPIGAVGRNMQGRTAARLLRLAAAPLTRIPGAREIALHRIAFILRKSGPE